MARKRGNGEGSITKRKDGLYEGRLSLGRDPVTGRPRRVSFYGKTRQEVADKLTRAMTGKQNGAFIEPSRMTLGQWLDTWLEQYAKPHVRRSTYDSYALNIRLHLKPALGDVPLRELLPAQLQKLYNAKLAHGRIDGQGGLSGRTVRLIHTTIHAALKQALKEGLVTRNVSEATKPPRQEKREMRVLSLEEQERFETALQKERLGVAFLLDLGTGLRKGNCWHCAGRIWTSRKARSR